MMYLDHFGLRELPFRLTPLTEFFFSGAKRGATVDALIYAILQDEGIVKVSGEVGSGKTMLCRVLIERLPDTVDTVYFANPSLDPEDLLRTIASELDLSVSGGSLGSLITTIQDELIRRHGLGRRVVALIDEAHAMPAQSLEQIRLLSNLETGRHKLLQLVLFGQPELDALLETRAMRPLKDRITHHFSLDPFSAEEVADYLEFRMRAAGYRGPSVFSPASTRKIAHYACGLSRRVNVLADKSLLAAYAQNLFAVNPVHVKTAARDAQYLPQGMRRPGWLTIPVILAVSVVLAWQAYARLAADDVVARSATHTGDPVAPPATSQPPESRVHDGSTPTAAQAATTKRREETPHDGLPPGEAAAPAAAAPTTGSASPRQQDADTATAQRVDNEGASDDILAHAEAALADWLPTTDERTWFIQLHTNTDIPDAQLAAQVARARSLMPEQDIRVYRASLGNSERTGVITGSFQNERDAMRALDGLPPAYRAAGAYVRRAEHLK
ncbi:ExeA family protein [Nitrogeniibacter aestuarii]|uniref:ExeA family protein n=1 Tax=Nitrogeniibacter aestuarii TaxID=2815343 RepID=UPI001D0F8361|nr:AAA family ATPase [Nitrogeniibacter aestuarii]